MEKNALSRLVKKISQCNEDYYIFKNVFIPGLEAFKKNNPDKKVVIVLYTGGIDSTYSLMRELDKGNLVIPIYNRLNCECNLPESAVVEYTLLYNIDVLSKKFYHLEPLKLNVSSQVHFHTSFTFYQQVYNAISIFTIGNGILPYVDEVIMSVVMHDSSISYLNEIKNIFNNSMKMMPDLEDPLKISLKFPLVKTDKITIHNRLKKLMEKYDVDLKLISCESPIVGHSLDNKGNLWLQIKPCETCNSCLSNKHNNIELKTINMISRPKKGGEQ